MVREIDLRSPHVGNHSANVLLRANHERIRSPLNVMRINGVRQKLYYFCSYHHIMSSIQKSRIGWFVASMKSSQMRYNFNPLIQKINWRLQFSWITHAPFWVNFTPMRWPLLTFFIVSKLTFIICNNFQKK